MLLVEVIGAWREELGGGGTSAHGYFIVIVQASAYPAHSSIPWGSWMEKRLCVLKL